MTIHRLPDWEARLSVLLAQVGNRPFEYGELDCGQFARMAIKAMTGVDLGGSDLSGYRDRISAGLALRHAGANDMGALVEIIASLHDIPEIVPTLASRGDIVLVETGDGPGLAVVVGEVSLAPRSEGLARVTVDRWQRAWRI